MNYRLSGEAVFPAQLFDVKGAVRWLRANAAKYALDPERIAAWGGSAGAHPPRRDKADSPASGESLFVGC